MTARPAKAEPTGGSFAHTSASAPTALVSPAASAHTGPHSARSRTSTCTCRTCRWAGRVSFLTAHLKYPIPSPAILDKIGNAFRKDDDGVEFSAEERREDFPGVTAQFAAVRDYPRDTLAAHVLGYLGPISPEEVGTPEYDGVQPSALVGRAVFDDRHVYFTALDNVLRALDRNHGALRWHDSRHWAWWGLALGAGVVADPVHGRVRHALNHGSPRGPGAGAQSGPGPLVHCVYLPLDYTLQITPHFYAWQGSSIRQVHRFTSYTAPKNSEYHSHGGLKHSPPTT